MTHRKDLIKTILRLDSSRAAEELEKLSDHELIILKTKAQFDYERHNVNLFRKGHSFHKSRNWNQTKY